MNNKTNRIMKLSVKCGYYTISLNNDISRTNLHLFSFKTPILLGKKIRKNVKSIV